MRKIAAYPSDSPCMRGKISLYLRTIRMPDTPEIEIRNYANIRGRCAEPKVLVGGGEGESVTHAAKRRKGSRSARHCP